MSEGRFEMISFSLKGKIALITGASRGIGEAIASTLASRGAECILTSRKEDALAGVVEKIQNGGGKAVARATNVGDIEQIAELFGFVEKTYGRLDIFVNNAATNPYFGNMTEAEEWAWDKTLAVNLKGPFFAIQKAVPLMTASGGGSIVNVSSVNGLRPAPMQGIYSISKAGLIAMTKAYAKELAGRNIRVNAILPGLTKTDFSKALFEIEEIHQHVIAQIPMQRHAEPFEMAGTALFLVSEAASYITGTCITADGGFLA
jgi:NAD(P)-dependent dehydrogenase (short-subunit alcohol dehydrogenase family)